MYNMFTALRHCCNGKVSTVFILQYLVYNMYLMYMTYTENFNYNKFVNILNIIIKFFYINENIIFCKNDFSKEAF